MITGFNTDVKYGDIVYHVQTEDKGTGNPHIESLVYVKGAILDSCRTSYKSFLNSDTFTEALLQRILEWQHRQLVIAIKKGQFRKGMDVQDFCDGDFSFSFHQNRIGSPAQTRTSSRHEPEPVEPNSEAATVQMAAPLTGIESSAGSGSQPMPFNAGSQQTAESLGTDESAPPAVPSVRPSGTELTSDAADEQGIAIRVQSSKVFVAGSHVDLNLVVETRRHGGRVENVQVLIKVIGTTFSPRLYAGKTDRNGNLRISFNLPNYTIGSAALIIQASTAAGSDELKYLIRRK